MTGGTFDAAKVRASYDQVAETYADELSDELAHRPLERALLAALPELAGLRDLPGIVADLGGGPGHVARHLRAHGVDTVLVDLAPAMATIGRHRHGVPALAGNLVALPLADASLAAAVVLYAVIPLDDRSLAAAAAELVRVVRPGGVVIVSIHVGDEVRHLDEWHGQPVDLDFRFMDPERVRSLLETVGLVVQATLEREPIPDVEAQTRRAYLLARRP